MSEPSGWAEAIARAVSNNCPGAMLADRISRALDAARAQGRQEGLEEAADALNEVSDRGANYCNPSASKAYRLAAAVVADLVVSAPQHGEEG